MADFKILTFLLGEQTYSIPISRIREIISMQTVTVTPIPHSAAYLKGIINLRGTVIPVVELRTRLGMREKEYDARTCILIVNAVDMDGNPGALGVVVDVVSEVMGMANEQVSPPPTCGMSRKNDYIYGIGKLQNKNLIILDIEKMFSSEDIIDITNLAIPESPPEELPILDAPAPQLPQLDFDLETEEV
jgi:purine-binding chemotaxis protein CheW